jgi:hypothetical protein
MNTKLSPLKKTLFFFCLMATLTFLLPLHSEEQDTETSDSIVADLTPDTQDDDSAGDEILSDESTPEIPLGESEEDDDE